MPKAYIIAQIDITDPGAYTAVYAAAATEALKTSSGRMLVRGGRYEALEGQARGRTVVVEFDSFDEARSYYFRSSIKPPRPSVRALPLRSSFP